MLARDIMSHPVISVHTSTTIAHAAELLSTHGFTAAPVLDDDDRLVGIVTEIDLIRGRIRSDPRIQPHWVGGLYSGAPVTETVERVMTSPVESLTPGADVAEISRMMADERIRCLPIVDGTGLVGIVSRRDVLQAVAIRDDRTVSDDIDRALSVFHEPRRWTVNIQAGVVVVEDYRDCADDREMARGLVAAVPGVVDVHVTHLTADPS